MFALLCFVLAVLASPFKSKSRLEAENGWMVTSGWAVAFRRYSLDYVVDEDAARRNRINI
jgi:endonuclease YncB( thermonuclease family)